jgi:sensor histidine kinase regulating citrate/malate metabolism
VDNQSIGIGLAASSTLVKKIGGDITLRQSQKGLTVFSFKVPVTIEEVQE